MKLGAMFCHSGINNFGSLPYIDFKRTKNHCQGGDCCDFEFVRHDTDADDGWEKEQKHMKYVVMPLRFWLLFRRFFQ